MEQIDEIMKEFLVECYENLDQLDSDLLELEEVPDDRERLASIFRTIHSIKGTSGFLALPRLERLTHVGESLLVPLRDGALRLNNEITDGLLKMVDAVRTILTTIEATGTEGDEDYAELTRLLETLQESDTSNEATPPPSETGDEVASSGNDLGNSSAEPTLDTPVQNEVNANSGASNEASRPPTSPTSGSETKSTPKGESTNSNHGSLADTTLRVDVQILDNLMNLVGELVLSRNQVLQICAIDGDAPVNTALQKLNLVTSELQESVMKTRMQPIRNAWNKLPRVIRDLASACGKKVQVEMEGADTELDKTVLEAIKDPLIHIVRNSVDHGIETPEHRASKGKPEQGTIRLRAFHEGGQVNIEIADDGRGMDIERIKTKAIEKGIITPEQADSMGDREILGLVLIPGFSTAAAVTNVSGRGVGMDVVKTNIERIGGTLDIQSIPGKGTTLRVKLPLTLAIVPALVVKSSGQSFAIPQVNLLELVRLDPDRAKNEIEFVYGTPVYRLRGNLLPILHLNQLLELKETETELDSAANEEKATNIVVLQAEDRHFGLVVDGITDTQEIVVKPLDQYLKGLGMYAGATIMGDGSVSLILDAVGLAHRGGVLSDHDSVVRDERKSDSESPTLFESWLVVESGRGSQAAVPLDSVARLENFTPDKIERVDDCSVVQYRGQIMPLVDLKGNRVKLQVDAQPAETHVVVYHEHGNNMGIVVNSIVDIVEEPLDSKHENVASQKVIGGRVTSIITPKMLTHSFNALTLS